MSDRPSVGTRTMERMKAFGEHKASRMIENVLALVGILQAAAYGVAEFLLRLGVRFGPAEPDTSFPWVTVIIFVGCVLPKTIGRATSGKFFEAIIGKWGGKG